MPISMVKRWAPSVLMMAAIFWLSSRPSDELPDFGWLDLLVKKGGHVAGYGLLAGAYWYSLGMQRSQRWIAWLLAVAYAVTDEFHQRFVPGRHANVADILIFDNAGALLALILLDRNLHKAPRPD
jgi:VanZ family protein